MDKLPLVSVIIPIYNEEEYIEKCLFSLKTQTYPKLEILVVDDGSTDKSIQIVKRFKKVKFIHGKHKGPGFSRNIGAKKAKGKILIFVDADMTFDKNYVKNLVKPILLSYEIIGTTHDYEVATNTDNIWSRLWGKIRVPKDKNYWKNIIIFRAMLRDKFLKLGGFDPKYGYADDQTFWINHGLKPVVARNTTCYHRNPESLMETFKQSRWIGASFNNFFVRNKLVKYFAPPLMLLAAPFVIIGLSVKKSYERRCFRLFFPWVVAFVAVRYLGSLGGVFNKIYLKSNVK